MKWSRGLLCSTACFLVVAIVGAASPANALWASPSSAGTGTLTMASLSHTFTPIKANSLVGTSGASGGDSYQSVWLGLIATAYYDITNTGSVSETLTGSVTTTLDGGVAVLPSVSVYSCAVAWNTALGVCSSGQVLVAGPNGVNSTVNLTWGTLAAGAVGHYQSTVGVALANAKVVASATESPTRSGQDRSLA